MLHSYVPAVVFLFLGTAVGLHLHVGERRARAAHGRRRSRAQPYESGLPSEIKATFRFGISFYLIAMLFILFDIEVVFLFPIAVQLKAYGTYALGEVITFIVLLFVAFVFVWRRGALEWR